MPPRSHTAPLTVVIPSYNRADALPLCLARLEAQTTPDFDVLVIDDGSTDATPSWLRDYALRTPLRFEYSRQANAGAAAARNNAVRGVATPLTLFIGDDILAAPDFIATHTAFHAAHPALHSAALGRTVWDEQHQRVTPLMRWMDRGFQFDYERLETGATPGWQHFYTSNLSLKTSLLQRFPFDEQFALALEDIELGYRIWHETGLDLVFLPEARASHVHPATVATVFKRARNAGRMLARFDAHWPAADRKSPLRRLLRSALGSQRWLVGTVSSLAAAATGRRAPAPLLRAAVSLQMSAGRHDMKHFQLRK